MSQGNTGLTTQQFHELSAHMAQSAGFKPQQLTKVQQAVILAHTINLQIGLQCIDRNGEPISFPEGWATTPEGVYKMNYKIEGQKEQKGGVTVQFRFVDNQQADGSISVNFSLQNSEELFQYELKFNQNEIEQLSKGYKKYVEEKLKGNPKEQYKQEPVRLQPVWRQPTNPQINRPINPIIHNPRQDRPFDMPFTGGEYVGPDNEVFRGRGTNNPLDPNNPVPFGNGLRIPPGARYDPIDPFGSQGVDEHPNRRNDFMGFNEFGQPIGGNRGGFNGPFNPNKFL